MCGIGGWIEIEGAVPAQMQLAGDQMVASLQHRGPDGYGIEIFRDIDGTEKSIAMLIHRRLSILGLGEQGKQPMKTADGRYWLTFNGEIYNYLELAELHGLDNATGTDTAILLQLWQLMGLECLSMLDGFFTFAIWDDFEKCLVLARDRTGVKPIYYFAEKDGDLLKSFWFASEDFALNEVLSLHGKSLALNGTSLKEHLHFGVSDRSALFDGISALEMGGMLKISATGVMELGQWYSGEYLRLDDFEGWETKLGLSEKLGTYSELLREQLLSGMNKRLRSDVPIGFAVSGGLDSAVLVGIARKLMGKTAHLHVFSVVSPGMSSDESEYQKLVVEHVGGIWHKIDVSKLDGSLLERYVRLTHRMPVAWNNLAHFALCEAVKTAGITVLFNGQGADELFGGYPHYYRAAFWTEKNTLWRASVRRKWPIGFSAAGLQWLKSNLKGLLGHRVESCVDVLMREDYYGERLTQLLRFEDRNGMAFGLESRNPFSDDVLMADAWLNAWGDDTDCLEGSLSSKLVNGYSKGYLRKAADVGLVPKEVLWRTDKKGFTVPRNEMTLRGLIGWQNWIMSDKLDGLVMRRRRQKALAHAIEKFGLSEQPDGCSSSLISRDFTTKQEKELDQLFRWAAVGCFLEVFQLNVDSNGSHQ